MDQIDSRFINSLSVRLKNFKKQASGKYNFSCPLCNDGQSHKKRRGYLLEKEGKIFFYCHNECGGMTFNKFLECYDPSLLTEYRSEKFFRTNKFESKEIILQPIKENVYDISEFLKFGVSCLEISDLSNVSNYLQKRQIPEHFLKTIIYTDKFKELVSHFGQDIKGKEESRLIIPFFDERKKVFAFSARSLNKNSELRYINIILDETKPRLFGLDRWNKDNITYVVEGAFDAMFINNTIATGGGDIISTISQFPKENFIVTYDNEPRSYSTKKKIEKAISNGYKVCIWPKSLFLKDINKMVQEGMKPLDIQTIIDQNTYSGMIASLKLNEWCLK